MLSLAGDAQEALMFGRLNGQARETLEVSSKKLAEIVLLARAYDAQVADWDPDEASDASGDETTSVLETRTDNPVRQELRQAIESLTDDEQALLVALTWVGRGDFESEELDQAITAALERRETPTADYLLGVPLLGDLLEIGAASCGLSFVDEEARQLYRPDGDARN